MFKPAADSKGHLAHAMAGRRDVTPDQTRLPCRSSLSNVLQGGHRDEYTSALMPREYLLVDDDPPPLNTAQIAISVTLIPSFDRGGIDALTSFLLLHLFPSSPYQTLQNKTLPSLFPSSLMFLPLAPSCAP